MIALKAGIAAVIMTLAVVGNTAAMEGDMFLWPGRGGDGDYENGIKAARAGDWQLSLHYLNRSVGRDPQDADALALLAISHRKLGRFDKAMTGLDYLIKPRTTRPPNPTPAKIPPTLKNR